MEGEVEVSGCPVSLFVLNHDSMGYQPRKPVTSDVFFVTLRMLFLCPSKTIKNSNALSFG